jgi:hypothetical protein
LKKTTLEKMWTRVKDKDGKTYDYGFGWVLGEINKHRVVGHGGHWQGFSAAFTRFPDDRFTVTVFANLAGVKADKLTAEVAAVYNPELAGMRSNH